MTEEVIEATDMLVVSTNSVIKKNGALVMGAGLAKEIRDSIPGIDVTAGELIQNMPFPQIYGFVYHSRIGFLQVKNHFKDRASLVLLDYSLQCLRKYLSKNPDARVDMNYPCIGNGGLTKSEVEPLLKMHLSQYPNVNIWSLT